MAGHTLELNVLEERFAVCRLDAGESVPAGITDSPFVALTRTADELSIVCSEDRVPPDCRAERGWRCLKVAGPLDFNLTGVLASLAEPLAAAGVSLFAVSTYDTDYVLVRSADLDGAIAALRRNGHRICDDGDGQPPR